MLVQACVLAMQSQVLGWGKWGVNVLWLQCWVFRGGLLLFYSPGCSPALAGLPDMWKTSASGLNLGGFFLSIGGIKAIRECVRGKWQW